MPGGEEREEGKRASQLRVLPLLAFTDWKEVPTWEGKIPAGEKPPLWKELIRWKAPTREETIRWKAPTREGPFPEKEKYIKRKEEYILW